MTTRSRIASAGALFVALLASGCAHVPAPAPAPTSARPVVMVLPLENLSGHSEYGARFTRLVWSTMGSTGRFSLVEPGEVEAMLVDLRIRSAGVLTKEQLTQAAAHAGARWILVGTLLECGSTHTPDGDIPTFSLALRLIDGGSGRVVWTDLRARSGEDRETLFGWGRELSLEKLADATTRELIQRLVIPTTPDSLSTNKGRP